MPVNLEKKAVATGLEKVSFHFNLKEDQCQRIFKLSPNWAHFSHASKVTLIILQARLQHYLNQEIPDVQAGFRKAEEPDIKLPAFVVITEKAWEFQKNIYFHFIDYAKVFDCVDHNKLWKILKETGIPDHPNCHLRSLYSSQGATVRTKHGTTLTLTLKSLSRV